MSTNLLLNLLLSVSFDQTFLFKRKVWLQDKFSELEELLLNRRRQLTGYAGVPFVLLVYPPEAEVECREQQEHLFEKLQAKGLSIEVIPVHQLLFETLRQNGVLEDVFQLEVGDEGFMLEQLSILYKDALFDKLTQVADEATPDSVLFLTRVASLYPFVRIGSLLSELENKVNMPLVIFYPGSEGEGKLSFLNVLEGSYYRARVI
jgi:hypothetical protein